jgi:hypothetical protein
MRDRRFGSEEAENRAWAVAACRAKREEWGEEVFREEYGTNENGRNAFRKIRFLRRFVGPVIPRQGGRR